MLYDPKWEVKPKYTLSGLIAWLETKPADGTYFWGDCNGKCLLGQYMASMGVAWHGAEYITASKLDRPWWEDIGGTIAFGTPWTFGAALQRARAYLCG